MPKVDFSDIGTGLLVGCAIIITGLLVKREFHPPIAAAETPQREVSNWKDYATGGQRDGPVDAAVTIVEFSDYQCPFCRQASQVIGRAMAKYPGKIRHIFRHYPLEAIHPHAMVAALASQCAGAQHAFPAFHDRLFGEQDSIGKRSWVQFAVDAGVADTVLFANCMRDSASMMPRIRADIEAGKSVGVRGTPAIMVNDHYIAGAPTDAELQSLLAKLIKE
jgi:protein-disulfide isomerase